MTEDPDDDTHDSNGPPEQGPPFLSPTVRMILAVALALLIVVSVVAIGVLYPKRQAVESDLDARRDVVRVAERFTVEVNNYDSSSVDSYKASVSSMLSTRFKGEFDQALGDIVKSVQQAKMDSHGKVLASGVASLDQDSAQVLVVADADVKTVFDTRQRHFRWEISLVKVDGRWLVDDFTPVS